MDPSDEERAQRRLGASIGAWRRERELGIGRMASVFLGRRPDGYGRGTRRRRPAMFASCQRMGMNLGFPDVCLTGAASGTGIGPTRPVTGAFTVLFDAPATRLTTVNLQHSTNGPGMRFVPSQPVVLLLSR